MAIILGLIIINLSIYLYCIIISNYNWFNELFGLSFNFEILLRLVSRLYYIYVVIEYLYIVDYFCLMLMLCAMPTPLLTFCFEPPKSTCLCKSKVFIHFLPLLFAVVLCTVKLCHLGQCTIETIPVLDKVPRSKANLTPV